MTSICTPDDRGIDPASLPYPWVPPNLPVDSSDSPSPDTCYSWTPDVDPTGDAESLKKLISDSMRKKLSRRVSGAMKSAIAAHGPITKELIGSATKRIVNQVLTEDLWPT